MKKVLSALAAILVTSAALPLRVDAQGITEEQIRQADPFLFGLLILILLIVLLGGKFGGAHHS